MVKKIVPSREDRIGTPRSSARARPTGSGRPRRPSSRPRRGWIGWLAKWTAVAAIWSLVLLGGILAWYASDLPDLDEALQPTRRPAITVLAVEDRRFYHHFGLDPVGLVRALVVNVRAGSVVQGGSTITQQAAKNLFLTQERTVRRKVQELILALWLEWRFSKDQILALYLNRAYFGAGAYGVDAAARKYFGLPATRVSTYQAAMLAGLLKAPSRLNPLASPEDAQARTRDVLAMMVDAGFVDDTQAQTAWSERNTSLATRIVGPNARYFVDWVMSQVPLYVQAPDQDLTVRTTLDPRLQKIAEAKVVQIVGGPAARKADVSQAALVALTPGGAVRALVGGLDYQESPFNRATQARRQPGSAFKPFVYAAGIESGLSADSRMVDGPIDIDGWEPKNFTDGYQGEMSLRQALAQSINTVAVRVGEYAGRRHVIELAHRVGLGEDMEPTPAIALGVTEVSPLELVAAYAAIANGGIGVWPWAIEAVYDARGRPLYARSGSGAGRVLSAACTAEITGMLIEAVETGTGRAARFGRPIAGKTGTSQNFRDAWFVGWSAELVTAVWLGNDDDRPMKKVTGGGMPAQLWRAFMADALAGRPAQPLPSLSLPVARAAPPAEVRPGEEAAEKEQADGNRSPNFWDRLIRVFGG